MQDTSAPEQIDEIINKHGGWKADALSRLRATINQAEPAITEEVKWKTASRPEGLPVWSQDGIVCFAEIWKDNVKLLFQKGAQLVDPNKLFNARLNSSTVRAIELHEGDNFDESALRELVIEAAQLNASNQTSNK